MTNNDGKAMPFLEQVQLFADTMNERFIDKQDSGKSIIIFALDASTGSELVQTKEITYGGEFELASSLLFAMQDDDVRYLIKCSKAVQNLAIAKGFIKPKPKK